MPGLPRTRLAKLLRRRNRDDATRAADALIVGSLCALCAVSAGGLLPTLLAVLGTIAAVARPLRRVLRRQTVLAALAGDGVVVVVGRKGGGHVDRMPGAATSGEADR